MAGLGRRRGISASLCLCLGQDKLLVAASKTKIEEVKEDLSVVLKVKWYGRGMQNFLGWVGVEIEKNVKKCLCWFNARALKWRSGLLVVCSGVGVVHGFFGELSIAGYISVGQRKHPSFAADLTFLPGTVTPLFYILRAFAYNTLTLCDQRPCFDAILQKTTFEASPSRAEP